MKPKLKPNLIAPSPRMRRQRVYVVPSRGTLLADLLEALAHRWKKSPSDIALLGACQVLLLSHQEGKIADLEDFVNKVATQYHSQKDNILLH